MMSNTRSPANRFDSATRSIADNAARDAQIARERASTLMQSKASLQEDHQPLAALVKCIVVDFYQPSGMYNHLLNASVNYKDEILKLKAELQQEIRSARGNGGQSVDPEDPTLSLMNATFKMWRSR
jgi:hypothetical protein